LFTVSLETTRIILRYSPNRYTIYTTRFAISPSSQTSNVPDLTPELQANSIVANEYSRLQGVVLPARLFVYTDNEIRRLLSDL